MMYVCVLVYVVFLLCLPSFSASIDRKAHEGIPWWSSGQDSVLSLPKVQIQSLVRKLRSYKPCGMAREKKCMKWEQCSYCPLGMPEISKMNYLHKTALESGRTLLKTTYFLLDPSFIVLKNDIMHLLCPLETWCSLIQLRFSVDFFTIKQCLFKISSPQT